MSEEERFELLELITDMPTSEIIQALKIYKAEKMDRGERVWVPRGYYSETKIKDDDVQMIILGDSQFTTKDDNDEE